MRKLISKRRWGRRDVLRTFFLVAILFGLFFATPHVPTFQITWVTHFLFVFTLTILIYKEFLNLTHTKLYLIGLISLMSLWELGQWLYGSRIEGSTFLTGLDTFFDLAFGFLGFLVVIKVIKRKKLRCEANDGSQPVDNTSIRED